jgi:pilus assembly protein Flp/PilA
MFNALILMVQNLRSDKRAVTALEYGLIASLIAVFIIGAVSALGTSLSSVFHTISTTL